MAFVLNGVSSDDYNIAVRVTKFPYIAKRRTTAVEVMGRDGKIIFDDGYEDMELHLSCSIGNAKGVHFVRERARAISSWLSRVTIPATIELLYPNEFQNHFTYIVKEVIHSIDGSPKGPGIFAEDFDIVFKLEPWHKLADIETTYVGTPSQSIHALINHYGSYKTHPLIELNAVGVTATFTVTYNGKSFIVSDVDSNISIFIDCYNKTCYMYNPYLINTLRKFEGDFIEFVPVSLKYLDITCSPTANFTAKVSFPVKSV